MVPDIFIDGLGQILFKDGLIRIKLVSPSGEGPEVRQRITVTAPAFLNALQLQQTVVNKFEEAGIVHVPDLKLQRSPEILPAATAVAPLAVAAAGSAAQVWAAPACPLKSPNFSNE